MKTNELTGAALDWAVAQCEGVIKGDALDVGFICEGGYTPSTNWAQGGEIIAREWINLTNTDEVWTADIADDVPDGYVTTRGATPLEAAMRCYVASKLGDEVQLPERL